MSISNLCSFNGNCLTDDRDWLLVLRVGVGVTAACEVAHVRTVAESESIWLKGLELGISGGPIGPSMLLMKSSDEDLMSC
jgi:hypothetical protein